MMTLIIIGGLIVVCLIAALMMGLLEGLGIVSESPDEEYEFVDFMTTPAPTPTPTPTPTPSPTPAPSPSAEDDEDDEE